MQQLQPVMKTMRAQPVIGGHINSRLANIDYWTLGSYTEPTISLNETILHVVHTISNSASRGNLCPA